MNIDAKFFGIIIFLVSQTAAGIWWAASLSSEVERLNTIETNYILMQADVSENTIFSREWPRGNLGSLPADSEQFMLIEHLSGEFDKLLHNIETGKAPFDQQQALTLDFYRQRIETLEGKVEILKDNVAELKAHNGSAR